jgi:two-component system chemotaxis sensor kinase CheA
MDDQLLTEFVNESREHLANIEADLLTIEEGGANIDEKLVNKVFRAAHSIKGSSGFLGLTKVKELAHKAETVLDMLRSKKMTPNAEVTNVLLAAFDKLREMITHLNESENAEIADLVVSLTGLASSYLPGEQKASLSQNVSLQPKGEGPAVTLPQVDFERAMRSGQYIYRVDYDLIHDIEKQGKNILHVFRDLVETGEILDCALDFESAGTLDGPIGNRLPLRLVFATIVAPDIAGGIFTVAQERIKLLLDPFASKPSPEVPVSIPTPAASAPPPVKEEVREAHPEAKPEASTAPPSASKPAQAASSPPPPSAGTQAAGDETLRVNVGLLETLMNLAGELVLSRNQLRAAIAQNNLQSLSVADQRLNQVTSELQDAIMRTRLQPIGNVFGKFPRVVRDMANTLHKEIELDIQGKDVALDRSLIEGLSDPLTHMVRNAVDHGVESPEERVRAGKKSLGTVRIEAKHEAGQVVVEIADDGKGIDPRRIGESALAKGLITAEKLRGMSDQDKVALIFLPGLSTAEKVTDISGRGVGMDVVKTNLDRLGGKAEIKSELGKGTLFRIKLPLTLAIIPSLIVSIDKERFAIPQINVEELLRIRAEDVKRRIEVVGGAEVLLLRDRIIPLVRFDRLLGKIPTYIDPGTGRPEIDRRTNLADRRSPHHPLGAGSEEAQPSAGAKSMPVDGEDRRSSDGRRHHASGALEIAVVTTGTMQYGLVVAAFHNTEEIVVKPLGRHLKGLREYAGATILGDGTVALILDVGGLATKAELASVSGSARALERGQEAERERLEDVHSLLLFHNAPDELCAAPLDTVLRVERVIPAQVEMAGSRRTMQYRGASLPLVTLSDTARVKPIGETKDLAVIVSTVRGREVGLLGAMPVDVIESKAEIDQVTHRQKGIAGSAIIRDRTTLVSDVFELVDAVYPEWGAEKVEERPKGSEKGTLSVLLAEDSGFFRAQVKRYLEEEGYTVHEAPDGEAAWELLLQHVEEVRAVVTDIEMPRLTGLGLAQRIRADDRTAKLPVIALTSLAGEEDVAKGKAVGIDDYQVKLDRDRLLESLRHSLAV